MKSAASKRRLSNVKLTRKYHYRYLGLWVTMTAALVVILNVVLYAFIRDRIGDIGALGGGLATEGALFQRVVAAVIAVETVLFIAGIVMLAKLTAHRIAGPYIRLKQAFAEVQDGNVDYHLHFRDYDHLEDLEKAFNEMMEQIRVRAKKAA
jgi:methyl-accepting chemotaxis protein